VSADFRYFAFISYSHADERWSRWLHNAIETYRVPKRLIGNTGRHGLVPARLTPVFRDRDELTGAADLTSTVREALEASGHLIVICSPAAARSRWVNEEVRSYKLMGRGDRILTLIVDGEPNAAARTGEEAPECFAPALRFDFEPDGSLSARPTQPIAADARPGKDGKTNAKLKVIAALLGVGFDELKQREHHRQLKRHMLVTAASVAGMFVAGALAVNAWMARQDAIRNRDRAEDLIGFMIGDFREQLEPLGKLELLKNVGDKVMAYFSSQPDRDITDTSLLRRVETLRQIGDVQLSLGEFESALASFQESLALSRELSHRSPDNQDWLFALGNAWFWVGYTHWQRGALEDAVVPMTEYLHAAERLVQLAPGNSSWQLEQGYALANLGSLAAARGDSAGAITRFEASNAFAEKLIAAAPNDAALLQHRIENTSWLASIIQGRGELREARDLHARVLQLTQELLALKPDDRRVQREEVLRKVFYGRVLLQVGQVKDATHVSGSALSRARELAGLDPANALWQWQLANVMELESRVLRARGRCGDALSAAKEGQSVIDGLSETGIDMDMGNLTRLRLMNSRAACLVIAGRWPDSRSAVELILERDWSVKDTSPYAVAYRSELATSGLLAGQVFSAQGEPDRAHDAWTIALDSLDPQQTDPDHRAVRAMLLLSLGRTQEASAIAGELATTGYAEHSFARRLATSRQSSGASATGS
jgi:eukaryotic-like serine/threonine-protein kinase